MGLSALGGAVQQAGIAGSDRRHIPPLALSPRPTPGTRRRLTWLRAQVGVEALRLEHDEQRAPAQEDCREEEVLQHSGAGHPPAAPMGSGQGGRHGAAAAAARLGSADPCAQTSASAAAPAARAAARRRRPGPCSPSCGAAPRPVPALGHPDRPLLLPSAAVSAAGQKETLPPYFTRR